MAEMQPITSEQIEQADAVAQGQGGAYIADRFRVDTAPAGAPAANYVFAGVCAIAAFVLFASVLAILIMDWQFLKVA